MSSNVQRTSINQDEAYEGVVRPHLSVVGGRDFFPDTDSAVQVILEGSISKMEEGNMFPGLKIDLRELRPGDTFSGGVPEKGIFVVDFTVLSNDGNRLSIVRVKRDGTEGGEYYTFIGIPKTEYRLYRAKKESEHPEFTLIPNKKSLPRDMSVLA